MRRVPGNAPRRTGQDVEGHPVSCAIQPLPAATRLFALGRNALRTGAAVPALHCLLAGCSFAPAYKVPDSVSPPLAYKESIGWRSASPNDAASRGDWWQVYGDAQLNALEARAAAANQDLKAAFARLQQARADTRIARADLFPTITATSSATRARASPYQPDFPVTSRTEGTDLVLEGDLSYELDFWGRIRNQVASAKANQQASAADLSSLNLSIQAEVASDYLTLRADDAQQKILDKTVQEYGLSLDLTQNLFNGGAAALADVAQSQAQLKTAQTQAADIRLQRAQEEHAIAVLVGENPSTFHLSENPLPPDAVPPTVDPGLPSALLERRPDVAEAERRVASANAQIGVARAAYFPQFTFTGSGGFNTIDSSNFLKAPSLFWSVGPQFTLPLFEGGRLVAQTERAKAAYLEQVANYRSTVLMAYQEVEDNLAAARQLEQENQTEAAAVEATGIALRQARDRYEAGIVTYLEVATAQTAALQAQLAAVNIRIRQFTASVLLVKALGGGWHAAGSPANAT